MKTSTIKCRILLISFLILLVEGAYGSNPGAQEPGWTDGQEFQVFVSYIPAIVLSLLLLSVLVLLRKLNNYRIRRRFLKTTLSDTPLGTSAKTPAVPSFEISNELEAAALERLQKFEDNREYLAKDMNLSTLAVLLNTNPKYAATIILKNRGKNSVDYLNELKIDYVVERLRTDPKYRHYSQKAIIDDAGFGSAPSFSRAFKAKTKLTFREFIRELQK